MNENELFCCSCDEFREYENRETEISHKIKDEEINLKVMIPYCKECGTQLSYLEVEEKHYNDALDEYRRRKNLLSPNDIKSIRELYGLSQRAFARTLGISEATLNRYELGAIQDVVYNNLILLVKNPENMMKIAVQNRANISKKEFETITNAITKIKVEHIENSYTNEHNVTDLLSKMDEINKKLEKMDDLEKKLDRLIKDNIRRETSDNYYKQIIDNWPKPNEYINKSINNKSELLYSNWNNSHQANRIYLYNNQ